MGKLGCVLLLCGRGGRENAFCLLHVCGRTMIQACGVQECPYCRHSRKSAWVCVCLSLCPPVSVCPFSWQTELWEKCPYQQCLLSTLHLSLGGSFRWYATERTVDEINPTQRSPVTRLHESLLISLNLAWPEPSRKPHNHRQASHKSGICVPLEANRCQCPAHGLS